MNVAKCDACGREVPANRENCIYCGFPLPQDQIVHEDHSQPPPSTLAHSVLPCPVCENTTMERATLQGVTAQRCPGCKGLFLDGSTFDFMVQLVAEQAKKAGAKGKPNEVLKSRPERRIRYINCPSCGTQMARSSYMKCSGVIFDQCIKCGVWLDDHELQEILLFIRTGGLEMAKRIEKEAKERQRLASLRAASAPGHTHVYSTFARPF